MRKWFLHGDCATTSTLLLLLLLLLVALRSVCLDDHNLAFLHWTLRLGRGNYRLLCTCW